MYNTIESVINTAQETAKFVEMNNHQVRHFQTVTMPWRIHKTWRFVVRCFIECVADGRWGLQVLRAEVLPGFKLMAKRAGTDVRLSWSVRATNYVVETSASLSPTNWQAVDTPLQVQEGYYILSRPATNATAFIRLRQP